MNNCLVGLLISGFVGGSGVLGYVIAARGDPFSYMGAFSYLEGGYICRVCGKAIIGKEAQHTREECDTYKNKRHLPNPDHSIYIGAEKYIKTPVWAEAEG